MPPGRTRTGAPVHTTRYFGVLAPAAKWRPLVVLKPGLSQATEDATTTDAASSRSAAPASASGSRYRPWAELLRRTFALDGALPRCGGRMRRMALITEPQSVQRFLRHRGEPYEPPARAPPRAPPFFKTLVVRRRATSERSQQGELFEEH